MKLKSSRRLQLFYDALAFALICLGVRSNESMRVALISLRLSLCVTIVPSMVSNLAAILASLQGLKVILKAVNLSGHFW
jgi:arginine decarboxylase-like protein